MNVSVFGLGYVGCVTAACLAHAGHYVSGVDVDKHKTEMISQGYAPFFESRLEELVLKTVSQGRLCATQDEEEALRLCEIALVCVGTPSSSNGVIRLDQVRNVLTSIGKGLRKRGDYVVVALRSTTLPNTVGEELIPLLEDSAGKRLGPQLGFVSNPEFLREGSAVQDFFEPPWNLIGEWDANSGDTASRLLATRTAPVIRTDIETALLIKYVSNIFHALKVVFANEVGSICRQMNVDSRKVMEIFCRDTSLNISANYLRPGFPFGGSCLSKDLRALLAESGRQQLRLPVLESILPSNDLHLKECVRMVAELGRTKIGLIGLTFKPGTDDLRGSPAVELAETLLGKGFKIRIFEPCITRGKLHGSNLRWIERSIPHIWRLLTDQLEQLLEESDVVVFTRPLPAAQRSALRLFRSDQICLDFVGAVRREELPAGQYYSPLEGNGQPRTDLIDVCPPRAVHAKPSVTHRRKCKQPRERIRA